MATTQLEVLRLWTRARRESDAATRQSFLAEAEQLTAAETDPREKQFARRVLSDFQRWLALRSTKPRDPATSPARDRRYRMAPARW
jgi:hypothetical protein